MKNAEKQFYKENIRNKLTLNLRYCGHKASSSAPRLLCEDFRCDEKYIDTFNKYTNYSLFACYVYTYQYHLPIRSLEA